MRGVEPEPRSPLPEVGKREAARHRARKTLRKGEKGPTSRTKKEEEEGEEEDRKREVEGNGGGWEGKREAAELPADPSSVSVEANDAKTGVHCPQLESMERENERERE